MTDKKIIFDIKEWIKNVSEIRPELGGFLMKLQEVLVW